jgi:TRAP-type uncharacterized transport system fused permease subunit
MVPSTSLSVVALSAFVGNYLYRRCILWERFALLAAGILLITPGWTTDIMGYAVFAAVYAWQWKTVKAAATAAA